MSTGDTITRTVDPASPGSIGRSQDAGELQRASAAESERHLARLRWAVAGTIAGLLLLAGLRLWFIDGLARRATIDGPSMAPTLGGASYAVDCGDCGFSFSCDAEHVPADRRAACPNCGYTRNELDRAGLAAADRVVIDRWRLLMRSPQRGEIVACDVPGQQGEIAVKRVAGAGREQLAIRGGDLYWGGKLLRKTLAELHAVRLLVHDNDYQPRKTDSLPPRWRGASDETKWQGEGTRFTRARQPDAAGTVDWLEYQHWPCTADSRLRGVPTAIRDNDSYNQGETRRPLNAVSDVLLTCRVRASGEGELVLAATDGEQRFEITIEPGRRILVSSGGQMLLERPLKLDVSRRGIDVEFGLCDQQVLLAVGGRTLVRLPYERIPAAAKDALHRLAMGARGLATEVAQLRVWRDVYYLDPQGLDRDWDAPRSAASDQFVLLGDNPPVSIDSRQWEPPLVPASAIRGVVYRPFWAAGSPAR
jgi:hypothetical protein